MKKNQAPLFKQAFILSWMLAGWATFFAASASAQGVPHLTVTTPGGFPGMPVMTSITQGTNSVTMTWDGPSGYYQLYKKSSLNGSSWTKVGGSTLNWQSTVATAPGNAFFRVSGPSPHYAGSQACTECHNSIQAKVLKTPHASAFTDAQFAAAGGQTNPDCLACHTVGYELPTGFVSKSATPKLQNVQCENCHGPAANHAANPDDFTVVPQVEIAATVCGGCHTGKMQPTYEEWKWSSHSAVTPAALNSMASSSANLSGCGRCHSGSVRLALLNGQDPSTVANDYNVPITCVVCHDPHQNTAYPYQVRNPLASTNYYSLTTSANFATAYNPNINLCGQCHNSRGAAWTDTARAPHHSVQYNFLLGSVGQLLGGPATFNPGAHAGLPSSANYSLSGTFYLTNQCASCHMQGDNSDANNHSFAITSGDVCFNCHITPPEIMEEFDLTPEISNHVSTLIFAMNRWAAAAAQTNALLAGTNVVAWEYTTPGGLTWQTNATGWVTSWSLSNPVTFTGPTTAGQGFIPVQVKQARFNLYLVLNDGSLGAHNPTFARGLLNAAEIWMGQLLQ